MDSFHGCYKDTTHDYRHFATLYLAVRFLNLLMSSVFDYSLYLLSATLVFVFTLAVVAKFQPYKHERNNTVDIILLLVIISAFISSAMHNGEPNIYPEWLNDIIIGISASIVFARATWYSLSWLVFCLRLYSVARHVKHF
jgi:hypothetical protein